MNGYEKHTENVDQQNKEIGRVFTIGCIFAVIICGLCFLIGFWTGRHAYTSTSDYYIELHEDSINVITDLGVDTTIHFDDLEEYIIRDNL